MDTREFSENPATISSADYNVLSGVFFEDKSPLLVLVEDQEDKTFWSKLFSCISDKYERIDVWPLQEASAHEMRQTDATGNPLTATGKDALMKVDGLCKTKVIAIDADLDLLTDYHNYSSRVRTDKHVIHTEYYSIENHLLTILTVPSLSIFCSNHNGTENWNSIFDIIGDAMCNAVKLRVASIKHRENVRQSGNTNLPNVLKISDINFYFGNVPYKPSCFSDDMMTKKINFENSALYKNLITGCSNEFNSLNKWSNLYCLQVLQGHSFYNIIEKAIKHYSRRSNDEIKRSIYSATQLDMASPDIVAIQDQIKQIF